MQKAMFFVGDRPYAIWDPDIQRKNLELLKSFDSDYFEYLADAHYARINAEANQHAATALQTSYGLAIETFFSLLGVTLQAPDCVFGWLYHYRERDLSLIIQGIKGIKEIQTRFKGLLTWESLSNDVHRNLVLSDKAKETKIKSGFASFWASLATDYLDPGLRAEFNSIKHGLRIQPGGFRMAIGLQEGPDVPAPPERMQGISGSEFGSTIFILEPIGKTKLDYRVREGSRNWDIAHLVGRLRIISMSLNNLVSFLLILNGQEPDKVRFFWPEDLGDFDTVQLLRLGVYACSIGFRVNEANISPTTVEQIKESYASIDKEIEGNR